ncbi:MAG: DUF2306 domain-containing protein [Roseiarcus sp.]
MTFAPLIAAQPIIQFHAAFAFAAVGLGAVQLVAPKGTFPHRTIGWAWAILMILVAGSSLFIHTIRTWGPWRPIHLLSLFTLALFPSPSFRRAGTMFLLTVRRCSGLSPWRWSSRACS